MKPEEQRDKIEQLERCYSRLFETEDGKKVLQDLRDNCFIDRSTADPAHPNMSNATMINEGCRRVFLHIVSRMKMSMTEFYLYRDKKTESKI